MPLQKLGPVHSYVQNYPDLPVWRVFVLQSFACSSFWSSARLTWMGIQGFYHASLLDLNVIGLKHSNDDSETSGFAGVVTLLTAASFKLQAYGESPFGSQSNKSRCNYIIWPLWKLASKPGAHPWGLVAGVSNVFPNYFGFSGLPESCEVVWDAAQVQGAEKEATRAQLCQLHQLNTLLALHILCILYIEDTFMWAYTFWLEHWFWIHRNNEQRREDKARRADCSYRDVNKDSVKKQSSSMKFSCITCSGF